MRKYTVHFVCPDDPELGYNNYRSNLSEAEAHEIAREASLLDRFSEDTLVVYPYTMTPEGYETDWPFITVDYKQGVRVSV